MSDETQSNRRASAAPQKRELEQAPQLVRKAATVLLIGALFPWLTAAATGGKMPWGHWGGAIVLTLLAGGLMLEAVKHRAGMKANGIAAKVADAHPMAGTVGGLVLFIGAVVVCFMGKSMWTGANPYEATAVYYADAASAPEDAGNFFPFRAVMEMATLFLALATLAHVLAYEYGGKFNPIFPLMFLGPAIAGALGVFGLFPLFGKNSLIPVALIGSLIVAGGGIMAMYTMFVSMKEAKVEGERKAALRREHKKLEREARRKKAQG